MHANLSLLVAFFHVAGVLVLLLLDVAFLVFDVRLGHVVPSHVLLGFVQKSTLQVEEVGQLVRENAWTTSHELDVADWWRPPYRDDLDLCDLYCDLDYCHYLDLETGSFCLRLSSQIC